MGKFAAALGAAVIEKHFTLDRGMEGPDHKASLEPEELKAMVEGIRHVEMALGDPVFAMASRYGRFVISPEGIFQNGMMSVSKKAMLSRAKGGDKPGHCTVVGNPGRILKR